MRHIPVFLNLACLALGIACLAKLAIAYAAKRDRPSLSRLAFFASYSYLMLVGFSFSYYLINVGSSLNAEYIFSGLIFSGMAAIEITFPWMAEPPQPDKPSGPFRPLRVIGALLTLIQAGTIWVLPPGLSALALAMAFIPFIAIFTLTVFRAAKSGLRWIPKKEALLFLLYAPILALACFEIFFLSREPHAEGYALLSLALAYGLTSFQFLRLAPAAEAGTGEESLTGLPPSLVERAGLSAREIEMARQILDGKENKEIAAELSISENTVRNHIYSLYQKLGIQRRMDLVRLIRAEKPRNST